jgi:hypothetical protein
MGCAHLFKYNFIFQLYYSLISFISENITLDQLEVSIGIIGNNVRSSVIPLSL